VCTADKQATRSTVSSGIRVELSAPYPCTFIREKRWCSRRTTSCPTVSACVSNEKGSPCDRQRRSVDFRLETTLFSTRVIQQHSSYVGLVVVSRFPAKAEKLTRIIPTFIKTITVGISIKINIIENHNYSPIGSNFNIQTLPLRRELSDVTFVYELIN
jgi:hypothetical protein